MSPRYEQEEPAGPTVADPPDEGRAVDDERVSEGLEHLQRAAREVIAASRAFLDVAEQAVDRPVGASGGLADLLSGLSGLGDLLGRTRPAPARSGDDPDDEPPVQRIPVS